MKTLVLIIMIALRVIGYQVGIVYQTYDDIAEINTASGIEYHVYDGMTEQEKNAIFVLLEIDS